MARPAANMPLILDRAEILRRLDHAAGIAAVRESLVAYSAGAVQQPPVVHMGFAAANGDCHVKCAHVSGASIFVVKVATGFYDNPTKGLPSGNGMMVALSATTGEPVALLFDQGMLTDWRTGYAGALATRLCWPKGATRLGIVGTGTQARMQLRALRALAHGEPLSVAVWGRSPAAAGRFAADVADLGLQVSPVGSLADLCSDSQVIITTTPATAPLVRAEWIAPGTHITAVGADAPGKQELENTLVARADTLLADSALQSIDHGEFAHAIAAGLVEPERIGEIGVSLRTGSLTRKRGDISIADLTGLGAEDAAIASAILASAGTAANS
ncbi:ornithine cyclodeaminase family protein [Mesorhizobium sp. B2-4-10]|uniref:ornithine cyclodeaminase family protein n=1 Tax=Mesorhizobium sp. B2-4-10 TaxID=2589939 RepID=UPI001127D5C6|nr:ornithine cyclodeaminase family protein [Mesorhizobium sp. B2-4-10]TPL21779.1 ornithine cyclodeaminase family protein [Mesorhizobium sp. B2-4-10]